MSNDSPWPWFWPANPQWNSQNASSSDNNVNAPGQPPWNGLEVTLFQTGTSLNVVVYQSNFSELEKFECIQTQTGCLHGAPDTFDYTR